MSVVLILIFVVICACIIRENAYYFYYVWTIMRVILNLVLTWLRPCIADRMVANGW